MPGTQTRYKILSGFQLKYIAAILMVLDHIYNFFDYTGKIPVLFSMLGRASAPLFVFCLIEGFVHTRSRKKYFFTIYAIAAGMGLIRYCFLFTGITRPDGYFPENQMLSTMTIILVILQGLDWCAEKHWLKGLLAVFLPLLLPYAAEVAVTAVPGSIIVVDVLSSTILPLHSWLKDGGTFFVFLGILLYVLRSRRLWQAAAFSVSLILIYAVIPLLSIPGFSVQRLFTDSFQWMGILAAVPMLMYNGDRGQGNKRFFYWFYPAHIYILYALSWAFNDLFNI
jgi:hypothetical protein